jgi:SDR family mycofactocin-dependent oxidoreductase
MGRLSGKVAFVTGAARGQGRSHAVMMAREGASIIAVDLCDQIPVVQYPMATPEELEETVAQVEAENGRILASIADVRDLAALEAAVAAGRREFGEIDVVVANAGIVGSYGMTWELDEESFRANLDTNLLGTWKTVKATVPAMIAAGNGGSIILACSMSGFAAEINIADYVVSKHGVLGLARNLAVELARHMIRVNTVNPTCVNTKMIDNPASNSLFAGRQVSERNTEVVRASMGLHALPIPWVEPSDVSNAVIYLASDESRYVTGTNLFVDGGALSPFKIPHAPGLAEAYQVVPSL